MRNSKKNWRFSPKRASGTSVAGSESLQVASWHDVGLSSLRLLSFPLTSHSAPLSSLSLPLTPWFPTALHASLVPLPQSLVASPLTATCLILDVSSTLHSQERDSDLYKLTFGKLAHVSKASSELAIWLWSTEKNDPKSPPFCKETLQIFPSRSGVYSPTFLKK